MEPEGVTLEDGQKLRHDEVWLVLDDGRVRELRLRVGRGIVRELGPAPESTGGGVGKGWGFPAADTGADDNGKGRAANDADKPEAAPRASLPPVSEAEF